MINDDVVVYAPDDRQLTVIHEGEVLHTNRFTAIMIGISLEEFGDFLEAAATSRVQFPVSWQQQMRLRYQEGVAHSGSENYLSAFDWWTRKDGHRIVVRDGNAYLEPVS